MTKRVRDIEWLLQWAIRDELKKRRQVRRRGRPSAIIPSAWDSITNYYTLGTRIDVSRRSRDPFGLTLGAPHDDAKAGDPHDDAKAVARAVNALPKDQSFANIEKVRALMRDYEVPAIEAGERVTRNLLCLPGSILEKALFAEKYNVTNIVIIHAQGARRPSCEFRPTPRQVKGTRGQPQLNGKCYGKDRYDLNAHMPLEYWPSVESVMCARADYAVGMLRLTSWPSSLRARSPNTKCLAQPRRPNRGLRGSRFCLPMTMRKPRDTAFAVPRTAKGRAILVEAPVSS